MAIRRWFARPLIFAIISAVVWWARRRQERKLGNSTCFACNRCHVQLYALSARSTDGGFYCSGCWEEQKVHASTHVKMVMYPPRTPQCGVCQRVASRLLVPELCGYQHADPEWTKRTTPPQWTCDECYKGPSKAVLYHHLHVLSKLDLPLPLTSLHDVDIYVTDFCFPKKGDAVAMQKLLTGRMQKCYKHLHIIDGVDATASDLVETHCHGCAPTVILWGSPHINVLADQNPTNQIKQESGMHNCEWKLEAFRWLAKHYPSSLILCPLSSHHHLGTAVNPMMHLASDDGLLAYEPLASHPFHLQRLCGPCELDVLSNMDAAGSVDVRDAVLSACDRAMQDKGRASILFLGEYTTSLAYSILM
ncbi:unnamed protein product [Symbiodinium sp. CCMP2592]|nr:unnamed protein product [Symbiodinium sp. CCMP2592]CAE7817593.1 unnamed protein product [Symbiodinium sp. CCMP2592]